VKIFDTLLGRTKPVKANLDALFSLPSAAVTLHVTTGYAPTGKAGVCFKPPGGQPFAEVQAQIEQLLRMPDEDAGAGPESTLEVRDVADSFGYRWIVVDGAGIDDLVTRVHVVQSSLEEAGWSAQLLCSVFAFGHDDPSTLTAHRAETSPAAATTPAEASDPAVYIVYLAKRGTFYPFAPTGSRQRNTELELSLRTAVRSDLPIEQDLARWFPLWDLPL
jgi:hypothetical protein